eukprot:5482830-Heterocapsa_arctica.AAC.1
MLDQIRADINDAKKCITELRPLGARLDNCKAAQQRALARKDSADLAVQAALAAQKAAADETQLLVLEIS